MQMTNQNNFECGNGDAFVAYLYGEMPPAERSQFEDHLLECGSCTDEFAVVANSRYSVYEWRKLEFEPMRTPVFEIPYRRPETVVPSFSWLDALKGIFATGPRLATAGAFGLLIAVVGFAFLSGSFSSQDIATVPPIKEDQAAEELELRTASDSPAQMPDEYIAFTGNAVSEQEEKETVAVAEPKQAKRRIAAQRASASPRQKGTLARQNQTGPADRDQPLRLNEFEDYSDTSLRLADLVADIGSSN